MEHRRSGWNAGRLLPGAKKIAACRAQPKRNARRFSKIVKTRWRAIGVAAGSRGGLIDWSVFLEWKRAGGQRGSLFLHEGVADVNAVVLDASAAFALTGDIAETGNGLRLAEVRNQAVWMVRRGILPFGVPEIGRLAVNGVFGCAVLGEAFLAVHIGNRPAVMA